MIINPKATSCAYGKPPHVQGAEQDIRATNIVTL